MRLAVFGGTFDPIHSGHLAAAVTAADAYGLDRVLVVPSGRPPHKPAGCRAGYEHRFRMVELACAADRRLEASRLEEPRGDGKANYSVDTVGLALASRDLDPPLRFIIGADAFAEVSLWRDAPSVESLVRFLIVGRPGCEPPGADGPDGRDASFVSCEHPASSQVVRHRAKIGGSLADLAPPAVCEYIWQHGLYRDRAL